MKRRSVLTGLGASTIAAPALARGGAAAKGRAFPRGFLWGTAISAHQSEGNNVNSDMWLNENVPGTLFRERSGDAVNSYELYEQDVALAASLGLNAYRFGIEWARIEPEPGQFSMAALDHYLRVLEACRKRGLAPIITYSHFTTPRWFAARGGFEVADGPDLFARFCGKATERLGGLIHAASTFNEINAPRMIPTLLPAAPRLRPLIEKMLSASARASGSDRFRSWIFGDPEVIEGPTREAHAKAYAAMKAGPGDFPIGLSITMQDVQAEPGGEARAEAARKALYGAWINDEVPSDFIGVQTYTRIRFGPDGVLPAPTGAEMTDSGYEYYPAALAAMVRYAARLAPRKPVYVTESGIATKDDTRRIAFIDATLADLAKCLDDGIDLRGYLHWSLLDNFEWTAGYAHQFGLVAVDRATFRRTPKPSALHLGRIARANRI